MPTASPLKPTDFVNRPTSIPHRYFLISRHPYYVDQTGGIWLERLWHQDFMLHAIYLRQLVLMAPREAATKAVGIDLVKVDVPLGSDLAFQDLYKKGSGLTGILPRGLRAMANLFTSMKHIDVVHPGELHWPTAYLGSVFGLVARKKLVVVVQAAPWRLDALAKHSLKRRSMAYVLERMARFLVNRADVIVFTQPAYRDGLLRRMDIPNAVIPASWINRENVLEPDEARAFVERKSVIARRRFLFAGRLIPDKGVTVLLEAVDILAARNVAADIDIIGAGALRALCEAKAGNHGTVTVRMLDPVSYGQPFFALLRDYDAVLVPSLSDEQPRIVFDAYSQGVPVIASDTEGLRPYVISGQTGWLIEPGSPGALANQIAAATLAPNETAKMGLSALDYAHKHTHLGMHIERSRLLASALA